MRKILNEKHLADLKSSGLNDNTIVQSGIYSATDEEVKRILKFDGGTGMVIPYPNTEDENGNFYCRVKPDNPPTINGKPAKYLSPKGSGVRLYIPLTLEISILQDSTISLVITEGEKKTLKAIQEKIYTVGLSGVWCFRQNKEIIPDLKRILWKGRGAYICFDSDAIRNESILHAEWELAKWLESQGAVVKTVRLPDEQ